VVYVVYTMIYHNVERTSKALNLRGSITSSMEDAYNGFFSLKVQVTTKIHMTTFLNCSSSFKRDLKCNALQKHYDALHWCKIFESKIGLHFSKESLCWPRLSPWPRLLGILLLPRHNRCILVHYLPYAPLHTTSFGTWVVLGLHVNLRRRIG